MPSLKAPLVFPLQVIKDTVSSWFRQEDLKQGQWAVFAQAAAFSVALACLFLYVHPTAYLAAIISCWSVITSTTVYRPAANGRLRTAFLMFALILVAPLLCIVIQLQRQCHGKLHNPWMELGGPILATTMMVLAHIVTLTSLWKESKSSVLNSSTSSEANHLPSDEKASQVGSK